MEREFNSRLKKMIKYPVYLPQEDGLLLADLIASGIHPLQASVTIFDEDIEALNRSELLVAVLNGPHVDSGVAFEIGYFNALRRPVLGLHTDTRSELKTGFNPMISVSLYNLAQSEQELLTMIDDWYRKTPINRE
jgi:nucleoside 2-deoxyribosyltransferase